jgi:hypothetical protein
MPDFAGDFPRGVRARLFEQDGSFGFKVPSKDLTHWRAPIQDAL